MANNPQFPGIQPLQPPLGSVDPPRNYAPPMPVQFRPAVPPQQSQHFIPVAPPHFQSVGRGVTVMNPGLPPHPQQLQFPQPMQHLPSRPSQPAHLPPSSQAIALPTTQPAAPPPPTVQTPSNYAPGFGGLGAPLSSSYTFAPPSYGQPPINFNPIPQYQPVPQMQAPNVPMGGQPRPSSVNQSTAPAAPPQHIGEQSSVSSANVQAISVPPKPMVEAAMDWKEHVSANGRRYYYNKKTKQSTWEKPYDLMTLIERADATTDWKEFTSPDGRKYYYNRVTKQSKWEIPEELKLARERLEKTSIMETQSDTIVKTEASASIPTFVGKMPSGADTSSTAEEAPPSPVPVVPVAAAGNLQSQSTPEALAASIVASSAATNVDDDKTADNSNAVVPITAAANAMVFNTTKEPMDDSSNFPALDVPNSVDKVPAQDEEEAGKDDVKGDKVNGISSEGRMINQEPLTYADKQEAKNAFKSLLESANVGSDWTWDQAMRVIINDRRYGALRTLGERKQVFNEFLGQKKKQETEERRIKQKKAREEFKNMLEESTELTSSTRWRFVFYVTFFLAFKTNQVLVGYNGCFLGVLLFLTHFLDYCSAKQ
uniref:Pre-mRNA-processing protein 40A n=1 Tax=Rhizophora mucronata TaxID=61149 RepID=A0A2P2KES2_RHIMU